MLLKKCYLAGVLSCPAGCFPVPLADGYLVARQKAQQEYSKPDPDLKDHPQHHSEVSTGENNFWGWDIGTFACSTLGGIALGASANFYVTEHGEVTFRWLAGIGLVLLAFGFYSFLQDRVVKRRAEAHSQRSARIMQFRLSFIGAFLEYEGRQNLTLDQVTDKAIHTAYGSAPLEDGEEWREALSRLPPTIGVNFDKAHPQGMLNIYHLCQVHGFDLSKAPTRNGPPTLS